MKIFFAFSLLVSTGLLLCQQQILAPIMQTPPATSTPITLVGTPISGDNGGTGTTKAFSYTPQGTGHTIVVYMNQDTTTTNCAGLAITNSGGETIVQPTNLPLTNQPSIGTSNIEAICNTASTAAHTITIHTSGSGCAANMFVQGRIEEWTGLTNTCASLNDQSASAVSVNGGTVSGASITTSLTKALAASQGSCTGGMTMTAGSGWTRGGNLDGNGFNQSEYQVLASSGTFAGAFTYTPTALSCNSIIATFTGN